MNELRQSLELAVLPGPLTEEAFRSQLTRYINDLINHDFNKLVSLLYRVDVDERKLKTLLAANEGQSAAELIASLLIERQLQKIKTRKESRPDDTIPDDEKW